MMNNNPWKAYQQHAAARSENVGDVFIQCYDRVISHLHSAIRAIEAEDIEKKTEDLNRALTLIVHMQASLNHEQGGESAQLMNRFFTLVRGEIFKGSLKLDIPMLRQAAKHFAEVRENWERAQALATRKLAHPALPAESAASTGPSGENSPSSSSHTAEEHSQPGWSA